MLVVTENTPNPRSRKFLCGVQLSSAPVVAERGGRTPHPLTAALLEVPEVVAVLVNGESVSVTVSHESEWTGILERIRDIVSRKSAGPAMSEEADATTEEFDDADEETVMTIKAVLDARIRPAVAQDGGDVVFRFFRSGTLGLDMRGACSGCPSSSATLHQGVQRLLSHLVPEVRQVVAA